MVLWVYPSNNLDEILQALSSATPRVNASLYVDVVNLSKWTYGVKAAIRVYIL